MMILHIARRELRQMLFTPYTWILAAVLLFVAGVFYAFGLAGYADYAAQSAMYGEEISVVQGVVEQFVVVMGLLLVLFMPLVTMRLFADEQRDGAMALLLSSPVSSTEIVLGKWLGMMGFWALLLGLGFAYIPISLYWFSSPPAGPLISGFAALILLSSLGTGIGLMAASMSRSPLLAAGLSWGCLMGLWMLSFTAHMQGRLSILGKTLGLSGHLEAMAAGLLSSADLGFFTLGTLFCLFVAQQRVESHRWS
jgi:ABC-2 type transport system permease protein